MADEAFALSPISARAVQPSEEDYDAISQAFMETSRGRWFLGEYAKRNRNADTTMVLDAVARIEQTLTDQKPPVPEIELADALVAIRGAVDAAGTAAAAALDSLALAENLAPIRKGIRVIKEISWRWREIGADARICDLIDSQLGAIEAGCEQIASTDPKAALSAAFDLITQRIAQFDHEEYPPTGAEQAQATEEPAAAKAVAVTEEAVVLRSPARSEEMASAGVSVATSAASGMRTAALTVEPEVEAAEASEIEVEAADPVVEPDSVSAEVVTDVTAEAADVTAEVPDITAEAADAYDEAVLDMVALEMAAPDPDGPGDDDVDEMDDAASVPGEPIVVVLKPEPATAPQTAIQPSLQPRPSVQPSLQHSLGSTLLANGIVRTPGASGLDPMAPIRRMSQAERIAFFS